MPSRGLGDTIAKITHATHLAALTQLYSDFTGKACQCEKRRRALNKLMPYRRRRRGK